MPLAVALPPLQAVWLGPHQLPARGLPTPPSSESSSPLQGSCDSGFG